MLQTARQILLALVVGLAISATPLSACACSHHAETKLEPVSSCHAHEHSEPTSETQAATNQSAPCVSDRCVCARPAANSVVKSETLKLKKHGPAALPAAAPIEQNGVVTSVAQAVYVSVPVPRHPPPRDIPNRGPPVS